MESVIINFEERGASRTADKVATLNSEFRNMKSVMQSLNTVIRQSDDKTEGLQLRLRLLGEMAKNADARMAKFKQEIEALGTAMKSSDAKVRGFREEIAKVENDLRGVNTAITGQEQELGRLTGRYEKGKISAQEYRTEQERIGNALTELRNQQATYEATLTRTNAEMKKATTEHSKLEASLRKANTGYMNSQTQLAQYQMELKQTENRLESLGDEAKEAGTKIDNMADKTKQAGTKIEGVNAKLLSFTLGMQEIGQQLREVTTRMFDFGLESYQVSKQVQSTGETIERTFKDLADEQKAWASETSKSMGVFENDLADASTKMYSLAQSFGTSGTLFEGTSGEMTMSSEELMKMTQKLTERAYDLAATYDTSVDQALGAVLSATKGNTEAIEDYGVSVQANALEQLALSKGIEKSVEQMTQAEKTALVMEQILGKTADTAGRYAYEIEAGLNPMLELDTAMKELQLTLGDRLKPLFDKGIDVLVKMMDAVSNLSPELVDLGIAMGVAVAGLAGISTIIGAIGVLALTLGPAFATIMLPLVAGTALAIPLIATFLEHLRTGEDIATILSDKFNSLTEGISTFTNNLMIHGPEWMRVGGEMVNNFIQGLFAQMPSLIQTATELINNFINALMASMPQFIRQGLDMVVNLILGIYNSLPYLMTAVASLISNFIGTLKQNLPAILGAGLEMLLKLVDGLISGFPSFVQGLINMLNIFIQTLVDHGPDIIRQGAQFIANLIKGIVDRIPAIISTAIRTMGALIGAFIDNLPKLVGLGKDMLFAVIDGITATIGSIVGVGTKIVEGLWDGLKGSWQWLKDKVTNLFSGLADTMLGWLPSEVRDFIGFGLDRPGDVSQEFVTRHRSIGTPQLATPFTNVDTHVPSVMSESAYSSARQARMISTYGSNSTPNKPTSINIDNNQPVEATIENVIVLDGKEMKRYTEKVIVDKLHKDKRVYKRS